MGMADFIVILIILAVVILAVWYMAREKKKVVQSATENISKWIGQCNGIKCKKRAGFVCA